MKATGKVLDQKAKEGGAKAGGLLGMMKATGIVGSGQWLNSKIGQATKDHMADKTKAQGNVDAARRIE